MGLMAILAISCSKKDSPIAKPAASEAPKGETITITVGAPEDIESKVAYAYDEAEKKLKLTWETGDKIVLQQGDQAYPFTATTISENGKMATFTGTSAGEGTYDVFYAGNGETAMTLAEVEAMDYTAQTQSANDNTQHLKFAARLKSVTFTPGTDDIYFTADWAKEHGNGTYQQSGAIRIRLQNPGVTRLKSVTLTAPSAIFPKTNALSGTSTSLTVSLPNASIEATAPIVVYAMLPWSQDGIDLPAGDYTVSVTTEDFDVWTKTKAFEANTLSPVAVNSIGLNKTGFALQDFYGGSGVEGDPYLVGNPRQMMNVNGAMSPGTKTYFKLIDDIDMEGKSWIRLNSTSPYSAAIDFDGNGKRVSNLDNAMFQDLNGEVRNFTLGNSTITSSGELVGILACVVATSAASISNVDIIGGKITSSDNNPAGLVSEISASGTTVIEDCDIKDTEIEGNRACGFIYHLNASGQITNCHFSGGHIYGNKGGAQYVSGLIGSLQSKNSTITDCSVKGTTISSIATDKGRMGGLVGWMRDKVTIKGCTVGTEDAPVIYRTATPTANTSSSSYYLEAGGFVGYMQGGTITKDDQGNHCNAYVTVTSSNNLGQPLRLGGFVGYLGDGRIEFCDAVVTMLHKNNDSGTLEGQHIGGFAGVVYGGAIDHCTVKANVYGNNWATPFVGVGFGGTFTYNEVLPGSSTNGQSGIGGFVGESRPGSIWENNSTAATVTIRGTNGGGFVGICAGGEFTGNSASGNVTSSGNNYGGFVGNMNAAATISKCHSSGKVAAAEGKSLTSCGGFVGNMNGNGNKEISECYAIGDYAHLGDYGSGGFVGKIEGSNTSNFYIHDCYATGNALNNTNGCGSFVGYITKTSGTVTILDCYATGSVWAGYGYGHGGFAGRFDTALPNIETCAAWSSMVKGQTTVNKWSAGAVVGVAFPTCSLTDNYRKPGMTLHAYWGTTAQTQLLTDSFQHDNVSPSNPLWVYDASGNFVQTTKTSLDTSDGSAIFAYNGKCEAGKTLSQLASTTLGWSSSVWDFSGDLPKLINNPEN